MGKEYYLGLDIGTDSVGWAVCDTDYKIPKFKGNAMWGIRLFEKSNSAEERIVVHHVLAYHCNV